MDWIYYLAGGGAIAGLGWLALWLAEAAEPEQPWHGVDERGRRMW